MERIQTRGAAGFRANSYLLYDPRSLDAVAIDPDCSGSFFEDVRAHGLVLRACLLTHGHFDHIASVPQFTAAFPDAPVVIHPLGAAKLADPMQNLSAMMGQPFTVPEAQIFPRDGETLRFGTVSVKVLYTPGHTECSVCYWAEGRLFSGDTLFTGSMGRTDFPDGDVSAMMRSLALLHDLPDSLAVSPGHEGETTLAWEKKTNPYMKEALR